MKERLYRVVYDDGHDEGEFTYYSSHKKGSFKNYMAMHDVFVEMYGIERFYQIINFRIYLMNGGE